MEVSFLVKFSEELCETIYDLVSKGYTYKEICSVCDIHTTTFYNWINRGEKAKSGKFKQFVVELNKAKAHRKNHFLDKLIEKAEDRSDWKAYGWLLEREYSEEYARPEVKIKQSVEAKAEVEVTTPLDEAAMLILKAEEEAKKKKEKK